MGKSRLMKTEQGPSSINPKPRSEGSCVPTYLCASHLGISNHEGLKVSPCPGTQLAPPLALLHSCL